MIYFDAKQVAEKLTIALDWTTRLDTGVTVSSGTVSAKRLDTGADVTSTFLASSTLSVSGAKTSCTIQAGSDGVTYQLTYLLTLSNGNILEEDTLIEVRNQ
jgi:hypothetical protein